MKALVSESKVCLLIQPMDNVWIQICSLLAAGASCLPRAGHQFLYPAAPGPVLYHYNQVPVKAQANCVFEGAGSGEVVGEIILTETETPDGDTEVT